MATNAMSLYMVLMLSIWDQISAQGVCLDERMDLVIIVDSSSTLGEENFELVLGLAETIVDDIDIDSGNVHVGFMTFGTSSEIRFELNEYDTKVSVIDAIYSVEYSGGGSNTADALSAARSKVFSTRSDRPDAQNVIILITDGYSDINADRTVREAELTRQNGIKIYAVGVGLQDTSELDLIASQPLDIFRHTAEDWYEPVELKTRMFPAARCDGELPPLVEETNLDRPLILGCDSKPMDLVFLLDTSVNSSSDYLEMQNFLLDFVQFVDIDSGAVRVAMVTFSTGTNVQFLLNKYKTMVEIQQGIRNAFFYPGDRNTADAFDILRRRVFFEAYGDRTDAPDILLLLTTGKPNRNVHRIQQEADALHQFEVNVVAVAIGEFDSSYLENIASKPAEKYILKLNKMKDLLVVKNKVLNQICRLSSAAFLTPIEDSDEQDLVFLLHFSNDMYQAEFKKILNFMTSLIERADIDSGLVRVGAALYRESGVVIFDLKAYRTKKEVVEAIEKIPFNFKSNRANLGAGINVVRDQMLADSAGDRQGIPNGVVVITDSNSNINVDGIDESSNELKDAGATIFTIGIGLENPNEIVSVASNQEFSYILNDVAQLPALTTRLQDRVPSCMFR